MSHNRRTTESQHNTRSTPLKSLRTLVASRRDIDRTYTDVRTTTEESTTTRRPLNKYLKSIFHKALNTNFKLQMAIYGKDGQIPPEHPHHLLSQTYLGQDVFKRLFPTPQDAPIYKKSNDTVNLLILCKQRLQESLNNPDTFNLILEDISGFLEACHKEHDKCKNTHGYYGNINPNKVPYQPRYLHRKLLSHFIETLSGKDYINDLREVNDTQQFLPLHIIRARKNIADLQALTTPHKTNPAQFAQHINVRIREEDHPYKKMVTMVIDAIDTIHLPHYRQSTEKAKEYYQDLENTDDAKLLRQAFDRRDLMIEYRNVRTRTGFQNYQRKKKLEEELINPTYNTDLQIVNECYDLQKKHPDDQELHLWQQLVQLHHLVRDHHDRIAELYYLGHYPHDITMIATSALTVTQDIEYCEATLINYNSYYDQVNRYLVENQDTLTEPEITAWTRRRDMADSIRKTTTTLLHHRRLEMLEYIKFRTCYFGSEHMLASYLGIEIPSTHDISYLLDKMEREGKDFQYDHQREFATLLKQFFRAEITPVEFEAALRTFVDKVRPPKSRWERVKLYVRSWGNKSLRGEATRYRQFRNLMEFVTHFKDQTLALNTAMHRHAESEYSDKYSDYIFKELTVAKNRIAKLMNGQADETQLSSRGEKFGKRFADKVHAMGNAKNQGLLQEQARLSHELRPIAQIKAERPEVYDAARRLCDTFRQNTPRTMRCRTLGDINQALTEYEDIVKKAQVTVYQRARALNALGENAPERKASEEAYNSAERTFRFWRSHLEYAIETARQLEHKVAVDARVCEMAADPNSEWQDGQVLQNQHLMPQPVM